MDTPKSFLLYADAATCDIDGRAARDDARAELVDHLLSSRAAAVARGQAPEAAEAAALASMGALGRTRRGLASSHLPVVTRGVVGWLVVMGVVLVVVVWWSLSASLPR